MKSSNLTPPHALTSINILEELEDIEAKESAQCAAADNPPTSTCLLFEQITTAPSSPKDVIITGPCDDLPKSVFRRLINAQRDLLSEELSTLMEAQANISANTTTNHNNHNVCPRCKNVYSICICDYDQMEDGDEDLEENDMDLDNSDCMPHL